MKSADRRPRKKTREENARLTRQALLKAAMGVVARYGYKKSSVSRITQAAGVAQGTLYSYFGSHEELLAELVPAESADLVDSLRQAANGCDGYFDRERLNFLAFAAYLRKSRYFLRVLTEAEIAAPASHAECMKAIRDLHVGALRQAEKTGEIRPQTARAFGAISEVLTGAPCHIAIGFGDRQGSRVFKQDQLPAWVAETFAKFVAHGVGGDLASAVAPSAARTPKPSSNHSDMRSRLLEAAARVIYESGFAGASVQAITAAAGVALATFYAYFGSRQELFDELLTYVRTNMLADVSEVVRGSRDFIELECRGFHAFFDYVRHNPWYIRIETEAALWAPSAYIRHFHDLADRYIASMQRSRARGELQLYQDHELPVVAFIMMAARHYLANRYVLTTPQPHRLPSWVGETYAEFVAAGLANDDREKRPRRST